MRKTVSLSAIGLLAAALTVPSTPAIADGPECNYHNHCYGITGYVESSFNAVGQELWTDCLVLNPAYSGPEIYDFASHEMWVIFPDNDFIEVGYIKGGPIAGGNGELQFRYFWGEWNGTTYSSHYISNAPILNYTNFSLYRNATTGYWSVYESGNLKGSTSTPYLYSTHVQTGAETSEPKVASHGKSRYLQTRNSSTNAWTWASFDYASAASGVYHVNHNAPWERMEQYSLQDLCDPLPGGPVGTFGAKVLTMDDFKASALEFAKQNGDDKPALQVVSTKRKAANDVALSGAKVDSDEDVHVIQMRGNFTGHMTSRPKGHKAPTGKVLTMVYNATTGELTDWSLSPDARDLAKLGSVKKL
jgi:hypothetical protein